MSLTQSGIPTARVPASTDPDGPVTGAKRRKIGRERPNWLAGVLALVWFVLVIVPIYYLVSGSLRTRQTYLTDNPLTPPGSPTLDNYRSVFEGGFGRYFLNNVIVTVATVAIVIVLTVPAAYAVARSTSTLVQRGFSLMLVGLAVPAQAVIVPIFLMINQLHLYDTLLAIILPTAAFALPVSLLVMTNSLRDIPNELYEAQTLDGAGALGVLRNLVLPLAKPAITTVSVFTAMGAWNGYLFPLVLTQSPEQRTLTLGLTTFSSQFGTNVPGLLAAVTLSLVPIFLVYLFARRYLLSGLTAGFGK
ncbi:carbohydrate ABC transporter permease [Modestobacter sp. NPDC049651]|uniref:carbohydrate ABC transporter permease n=1 Tax=unclassified Modestobacter TaxID=2643866 RepID=UPI00340B0965